MTRQAGKLGLGTVQWGMPYGIANRSGQTPRAEVARILDCARTAGVSLLDTAHAYGDAERVLGECGAAARGYSIVTKTPAHAGALDESGVARFAAAFEESLDRLDCRGVEALLVHTADNLLGPFADRLWETLERLRADGRVRKIGVSVYRPAQLEAICARFRIDVVQLPFNLYDDRFRRAGLLAALKRERIEIHARSPFLQGLLLMSAERLPAYFEPIAHSQNALHNELRQAGLSVLEGALRFCLSRPEIDSVIVGCESAAQLEEVLRAAAGELPASFEPGRFVVETEAFVDPTTWPRVA